MTPPSQLILSFFVFAQWVNIHRDVEFGIERAIVADKKPAKRLDIGCRRYASDKSKDVSVYAHWTTEVNINITMLKVPTLVTI